MALFKTPIRALTMKTPPGSRTHHQAVACAGISTHGARVKRAHQAFPGGFPKLKGAVSPSCTNLALEMIVPAMMT